MLVILVILIIIIFFCIFLIGLVHSDILIDIENCHILYSNKKLEIETATITIKICFFKIFKIKLGKKIKANILKKIEEAEKNKNKFTSIAKLIFDNRKNFKNINANINSLHLNLYFGTTNQMITTFSIPFISTFISIILSKLIYSYDEKNYNYRIFPQYSNENYLSINLITEIKFPFFNFILLLLKMRKKENN